MNSQVAGYYRGILYADTQDSRPIPKSLMTLNMFAEKRHQALQLGSTISKAVALSVAMSWMLGTKEGREFAMENTNLGDILVEDEVAEESGEPGIPGLTEDGKIDWSAVQPQTPVVITHKDGKINARFLRRRHSWIDVIVDGNEKHFPIKQVHLAGA